MDLFYTSLILYHQLIVKVVIVIIIIINLLSKL